MKDSGKDNEAVIISPSGEDERLGENKEAIVISPSGEDGRLG